MKAALLVIGYGNTLRQDDGVGPEIARRVAAWGLADLQTWEGHQLVPELADLITGAQRVVFVDAALNQDRVRIEPIQAQRRMQLGHTGDPRWLLSLTEQLHGSHPPAWWLTLPVAWLDFGESFSPLTERSIPEALTLIRQLVDSPEALACTR